MFSKTPRTALDEELTKSSLFENMPREKFVIKDKVDNKKFVSEDKVDNKKFVGLGILILVGIIGYLVFKK